jgi:hypothetical protein
MKIKEKLTSILVAMLVIVFCMSTTSSYGQTQKKEKASATCCTMKEGKMMCMVDGKMSPMTKDMTMKNGTKCMKNGECVMKDGKKMKMKNGECMDMNGKICSAKEHGKQHGNCCNETSKGKYFCPMHKEVTSDKQGKCPKCKMDLKK